MKTSQCILWVKDVAMQITDLHERELGALQRKIEAGSVVAVLCANEYCVRHGLPIPQWLARASVALLCHLLPQQPGHASMLRKDRTRLINHVRWDTVVEIRSQQQVYRRQIDELRQLEAELGDKGSEDVRKRREELERALRTIGTWERAYEFASKLLEGSPAHAGPDAIKRSYMIVERENKRRNLSNPYVSPDIQTLRHLGWEEIAYPSRVKKEGIKFHPET